MEKILQVGGHKIRYQVRRHSRARYLRLTVKSDLRVIVTAPNSIALSKAELWVTSKTGWLIKRINAFQARAAANPLEATRPRRTAQEFNRYRHRARALITKKVKALNAEYGFSFRRISIRSQETRWGSCSAQKNLNFNYRLFFLEERLIDYVVVHELCHLREMNHSAHFWELVEKTVPDYKQRRQELKKQPC